MNTTATEITERRRELLHNISQFIDKELRRWIVLHGKLPSSYDVQYNATSPRFIINVRIIE